METQNISTKFGNLIDLGLDKDGDNNYALDTKAESQLNYIKIYKCLGTHNWSLAQNPKLHTRKNFYYYHEPIHVIGLTATKGFKTLEACVEDMIKRYKKFLLNEIKVVNKLTTEGKI